MIQQSDEYFAIDKFIVFGEIAHNDTTIFCGDSLNLVASELITNIACLRTCH